MFRTPSFFAIFELVVIIALIGVTIFIANRLINRTTRGKSE